MNWPHRRTSTISLAAAALFICLPAVAQNPQLQEKLADVKAAAAANKQQLRQYQWTETIQLTLKGDAKEPQSSLCQYGPDGQIQKTPIGPPPAEPSGGRMKQRIIEKKKAEIQGYMGQVKGLLSLYVPPDAQRMQDAYAAGNFAMSPIPGAVNLVFTNYAQPGDRMTIKFDTATKKILTVDVDTYLDEAKDAVTLHVIMATLPAGPNYAQQTVINAKAKSLVVTTTNSNYQKL